MYWITGILGLAFAVALFIFGYADNPVAMWTSIVLGGGVLLTSLVEGAGDKGKWEYWVTALVGLGAVAAPFVLGFGSITIAMWTSVGIGLLLALIAGSKLYYGQKGFQ